MNAPTRIDPLAIQIDHLDAAIAALVALRLRPSRDSYAWYRALVTFDKIEGRGALEDPIADCEFDLGIGDAGEPECLACGASSCGCDQAHDDRSSWGMTAFRTPDGGYGVAA